MFETTAKSWRSVGRLAKRHGVNIIRNSGLQWRGNCRGFPTICLTRANQGLALKSAGIINLQGERELMLTCQGVMIPTFRPVFPRRPGPARRPMLASRRFQPRPPLPTPVSQESAVTDAIEFREIVRARTNIVELIGESVSLSPRRGGSEFVGLCPFHDDHNPSMCVYPDRQSYRCWVCEAGGDVFTFVMKHENVAFLDALRLLADRAHLEMPRQQQTPQKSGPKKPRLLEVLTWADRQFRACLLNSPTGAEARDYLASRGVSAEMITQFGLGYHPPEWRWLLERASGICSAAELKTVDLARQRRDGTDLFDSFVDRLLFPIRDERGRVVAFGGRVLPNRGDSAGPKYLNSSDTPVFSKSQLVYGLDVAREEMRRTGVAIVMEGYTDCIAAHQAGYTNTVATLGTALAESHVTLLRRFARTVVLVFDGDQPGLNAAERALSRFLAQDVDLRILALPSGLDPAEFLANDEQRRFGEMIAEAPEALEFKRQAAIDRFGFDTVDARARVATDVLATLGAAPRLAGSLREGLLLRKLADELAIPEATLRGELNQLRERTVRRVQPVVTDDASTSSESSDRPSERNIADDSAERELLAMIVTQPHLFATISRQVGPGDFRTPRLRDLFEYIRDVAEEYGEPSHGSLMANTEDADLKRFIVGLDVEAQQRGLERRLEESTQELEGTELALTGDESDALPPLVAKVVQRLIDRRELSEWQANCGRVFRTHETGNVQDEAIREKLRRLNQQLASKHR